MKLKDLMTIITWIVLLLFTSATAASSQTGAVLTDQAPLKAPMVSTTPRDGTIKAPPETDIPNGPASPCQGDASKHHTSKRELITLKMAKQIALEKNPTLAAARQRIYQAREAIVQARAGYLPTLTTTSTWNYTERTGNYMSEVNENLYYNKISATLILFDGFLRKYATLAATFGEKVYLTAREDTQRLLAWSVSQSFLNIQLARENIKIAESDMAFNQQQEKDALAREKSGAGSLSDVLNFKTKVNTAKAFLISYEQDLKESCHGLAALMGYARAQFPETVEIGPLDIQIIDLGAWENKDPLLKRSGKKDMETFLARRPDLMQSEYAVKAADAKINMAASGYYPTVSMIGSYGINSGQAFIDMADTDKMGAAVGVTVNFELYSGGATKSSVKEARSIKKELEKEWESSKLTAMSNIKSAADDMNTTRRQLLLQKENTDLVERMRNLVEKEYAAGQASLVRLNEAQNALVGALGDLAIARVSFILAMERFDYYTGNNIH